jgi:putative membrane protein
MNARGWRFPATLLALFAIVWTLLAINPVDRSDWLLENLLTVVTVPVLILTRGKLRFSNTAYLCLFVFFCLHTVGSHYTYSLVPYDEAWRAMTGHSFDEVFGFERNQYDRAIHFLYGVLILLPSVELFAAYAPPKTAWRLVMPVFFVMGHSVVYELIEWIAALLVAPELGQAYLGTQGDEWDSQKDMALATLGSILAMFVLRLSPRWNKRFATRAH